MTAAQTGNDLLDSVMAESDDAINPLLTTTAFNNYTSPSMVHKWAEGIFRAAANPTLSNRNTNLAAILRDNKLTDGTDPSDQQKADAGAWLYPLAIREGTRALATTNKADGYEMMQAVINWANRQPATKRLVATLKAWVINPHAPPNSQTPTRHEELYQHSMSTLEDHDAVPDEVDSDVKILQILVDTSTDHMRCNFCPYMTSAQYDYACSKVKTAADNIRVAATVSEFWEAARTWAELHNSGTKDPTAMQPGFASDVPSKAAYTADTDHDGGRVRTPCHFWARGTCKKADKCNFAHVGSAGAKKGALTTGKPDTNGGTLHADECQNWLKGRCANNGRQCKYHHKQSSGGYRKKGSGDAGKRAGSPDKRAASPTKQSSNICFAYTFGDKCPKGGANAKCPKGAHDKRARAQAKAAIGSAQANTVTDEPTSAVASMDLDTIVATAVSSALASHGIGGVTGNGAGHM